MRLQRIPHNQSDYHWNPIELIKPSDRQIIGNAGLKDSYTKLLITGNGANGSQAILDSTGKTVTVNGNTNISTAQSVINGSSIYFDGSGDYLSLVDSSDWDLSPYYTVDCWSYGVNTTQLFCGYGGGNADWGDTGGNSWHFIILSGTVYFQYHKSGNTFDQIVVAVANITNSWIHWGLVINNNALVIYRNGVSICSGTLSGYVKTSGGTPLLAVGTGADRSSAYHTGYLSYIRISKGQARWTSNFTPPLRLSDYLKMGNYIGA